MQSQNTINKLSRRNWLRDTAIAATGVALVPSFLTGCTDHLIPEPGELGDTPITEAELRSARDNLQKMFLWVDDLLGDCRSYEFRVYTLLKSGEKPKGWTVFLIDIFTYIGIGLLQASVAGIPGLGPLIGAAIAVAKESITTWGLNPPPNTVDGAIAEFMGGFENMMGAIKGRLKNLQDDHNNFQYMRTEFESKSIEFNGKSYTLKDLANADFPAAGLEYTAMKAAALLHFKKQIWTVMFIKAGTMSYSDIKIIIASGLPHVYATEYYSEYPDTYWRGRTVGGGNFTDYWWYYWYWEFDGLQLSAEAAKELFKDTYPGNIVNPNALFDRDYVYKQFHLEKPDFGEYYDVRRDKEVGPGTGRARYFDEHLDFDFNAGGFLQLIKK